MKTFKLVILDYAKEHLTNPKTQKALNDLIVTKQQNFVRTDENYVVVDKHDMIGTHYMIYDNSDLYEPKLVFAIRTTFEDRAKKHHIKTPLQELYPHMGEVGQRAYEKYKGTHPILADCNSWFVDPDYSVKGSGLNLADIGYTMVYAHLLRSGFNHFVGCANERFKASRHVEKFAEFEKELDFTHPVVPDRHRLIFVDSFKKSFFQNTYEQYKPLFDSLMELLPPHSQVDPWNEAARKLFENHLRLLKAA